MSTLNKIVNRLKHAFSGPAIEEPQGPVYDEAAVKKSKAELSLFEEQLKRVKKHNPHAGLKEIERSEDARQITYTLSGAGHEITNRITILDDGNACVEFRNTNNGWTTERNCGALDIATAISYTRGEIIYTTRLDQLFAPGHFNGVNDVATYNRISGQGRLSQEDQAQLDQATQAQLEARVA